jgi:hypothetical protein
MRTKSNLYEWIPLIGSVLDVFNQTVITTELGKLFKLLEQGAFSPKRSCVHDSR